ncbi:MAG: DeoR/GlpR transcriptional regulator [Paracoccus denitrificans]|uniref:DeoR/GlpR transcriptional regulator n=1 Tax=Paracoccus denitrificans TaxID=266 RepID=A0A533I9H7_PARDE|nr:MAG: DeoR/GlpR transcriptional regulator [Paracoccus denitrificans]
MLTSPSPLPSPEPERLRKGERRKQILLELKLRQHLRIGDLAERFRVSTETVRRDLHALAKEGLIDRAHGGALPPAPGVYPSLDERQSKGQAERERIGRLAASLVKPGETLMIDSGTTTMQMARFLAFQGTACRVITNSLPIAMTLGGSEGAQVLLCPGDYLPSESAVIGDETLKFLQGYQVDRAFIGATALSLDGVMESVPGFAAVKGVMLAQAASTFLLIHSMKLGGNGFRKAAELAQLDGIIVDRAPPSDLARALTAAKVEVAVAN